MGRGIGPGSGGVVLCLDALCRWQVQVSVYTVQSTTKYWER